MCLKQNYMFKKRFQLEVLLNLDLKLKYYKTANETTGWK